MISTTKTRQIPISPRKVRVFVHLLKGKSVLEARYILALLPQKAAKILLKALLSASATHKELFNTEQKDQKVDSILVDGARSLKRMVPRARGSRDIIHKRMAHITINLTRKGQ